MKRWGRRFAIAIDMLNEERSVRCFAFILCAGLATTTAMAADKPVTAMLSDAQGKQIGQATFIQQGGGVKMTVIANGLTPGLHGIHLHAVGQCKGPDFASAGGHWNPMHKMHGTQSPQGPHMGDLPNITVGPEGKGRLETTIAGATLDSGPMGLLDSDGTALVIHAGPDDNKTDPSGNSGGRVACGVVTAS
jgi:Cu-Zn family superoxide dismutase